jgi:Na+:H+ antiporter, NhaA family
MLGDDEDALGALQAVTALERRIQALRSAPAPREPEGGARLTPPSSDVRDHVAGPESAEASLVVFGAYGAPESRALGRLLRQLRDAHPGALRAAWRHLPAPGPDGAALALVAEAAAVQGRFWSMSDELLALHRVQIRDVHDAARRAGLDFDRLVANMRAGVGAERVVADVACAVASAVTQAPALFVNGRRFSGGIDADAVWAALRDTTHV